MNKYMDGIEYERFCMKWLKDHGYHNIHQTKASGDQGIDILAEKHGKKYGFQCKYYQTPVGNEAVQQAFSGAAFYHCDAACVITNNSFTKNAVSLAEETDVILYENIVPEDPRFLSMLYSLLSLCVSIIGIYFLIKESRESSYSELRIFISVCLAIGGLCGVFCRYYACAVLAILTVSTADLLLFKENASLYLVAFISIYDILLLIRLILLQKERTFRQQQILQQEISEAIKSGTDEIGKQLQDVLRAEFGCEITLISAKHASNTSLEFTFRANRNIEDDIALAEYSLNQYSVFENDTSGYKLEAISKRTIRLTISK